MTNLSVIFLELESKNQKLLSQFMHHNLVKKEYIDEAEHWRYSFARNYAGVYGFLEIERLC